MTVMTVHSRIYPKQRLSWTPSVLGLLMVTIMAGFSSTVAADDPYIGEVRWFAGNFAPRGWAQCDGQLLQISQYSALFSILGTTYGGDGRSTFGLPDVRGRFPLHSGRGPGLTPRLLGAKGGSESQTLTDEELPVHSHVAQTTTNRSNQASPTEHILARQRRERLYDEVSSTNPADTTLSSETLQANGGNGAHNNLQPYLGVNCIIALQGIYPSRS